MGVSPSDIEAGERLYHSLTGQGLNWLASIYFDWHPKAGKISVQNVLGDIPGERKAALVMLAFDFTRYSYREDLAKSLFSDRANARNSDFLEFTYRWLPVEQDARVKYDLTVSALRFAESSRETEERLISFIKGDKQLAEALSYYIWSRGAASPDPMHKRIWDEIEKLFGDPHALLPDIDDSHLDGFDNTFYMPL